MSEESAWRLSPYVTEERLAKGVEMTARAQTEESVQVQAYMEFLEEHARKRLNPERRDTFYWLTSVPSAFDPITARSFQRRAEDRALRHVYANYWKHFPPSEADSTSQ